MISANRMTFLRKFGRGSVRSTVGRKPLSALPKEVAPAVCAAKLQTAGGNPHLHSPSFT